MPEDESDYRAKTRERFNEVFKKYSEAEQKKKKKKKKRTETQESIALQNLRKDLSLEKDAEDEETILQNTYRPEQGSPRYTKNQRREREMVEKVNTVNGRNQEETPASKGKRKNKRGLPSPPGPADPEISSEPDGKETKRRSKKGAAAEVEDAEDELLHAYQQHIAQEKEKETRTGRTKAKQEEEEEEESVVSQTMTLNNDVGKKKKKKLRSVITHSEEGNGDADREADPDQETESKGKKKKKKKKHIVEGMSDAEEEEPPKPAFDDSLVLGVYIHRSDRLKNDLLISHPMVKIHVVDELTGQYVKKEDSGRPVASFYEQKSVDHILPIMTQPFDFKKNKSIIPEWQEQIVFNERFGHFVQPGQNGPAVLLFFEILDFITMEESRTNVDGDKHERGFRKIAWAFLKLVGANGVLNTNTKLRLQLFCPPPQSKRQARTIEVFEWWRRFPRHKYASTLYVTVKGIRLPEHVDPSVRSMMALQEERGSTSFSELQKEATRRNVTQLLDSKPPTLRWSRLPGQFCRIPNKPVLSFRGGKMGCFTLLFSHGGTVLAAACADRDAFPVIVYEIPSGTVLAAFGGHLKIVYDLCWSRDDRRLLSASSDGTVREWDVEELQETAQKVLPHPSFVYCARYHPSAQNLAVSGSYDSLLRVWRLDVDGVNGQLLQEFEGHGSFINTLCFDAEGERMFSADNTGLILVWRTSVNHNKQPCRGWCQEKKIDENDLRGVAINMLQLHPNGRCLLVHAKDSVLRMMDLRILAVKKYIGATNYRERIYSTFTPCGNFIFSGSEDGMAYVWNTDTGDQVAVYSELCYPTALHSVSFHPHENMVAFCAFGPRQPVQVYLYDHKVSQLEALNVTAASAASRSASTDRLIRNTPDPPALLDTAGSALDQFAQSTRLAMKMRCVKEQLDSVLEPRRRSSSSGFIYDHDRTGMSATGRSLASESGMVELSASLAPPSFLSPHSKLRSFGSGSEQLVPQNRGFSPVGRHLKGASSLGLKPILPENISPGLRAEPDSAQRVLVSLYDYRANRSDELTVRRGDVIRLLYKDNDCWWFGRAASGQEGYFLASYVVDQGDFTEEADRPVEEPTASPDGPAERATPTRVSAAISSSGELRILSELTLSDSEPEETDARRARRKKVRKSGVFASTLGATSSDADASQFSSIRRNRPLPKRPTGRTNDAFTSDE